MIRKTLNAPCVKETRLVAFCKLHRVSLTAKEVRMRNCIEKSCHHFQKYKHVYWDQLKAEEERKKRERERIKKEIKERRNNLSLNRS